MFQALGNTLPGLLPAARRGSSHSRFPRSGFRRGPGFELKQLWFLSVATVSLQALTSLFLLRGQFQRRLVAKPAAAAAAA